MSYKIILDSCGELPQELKEDEHFERVPLELCVGEDRMWDDETFDQADFLQKVAACPTCPKSACPSPERFMQAYDTEAEDVYVVTLSSNLSGSYNSAVLAKSMYLEQHPKKNIHVFDSCSASCGETQIALYVRKLIGEGLGFEEIIEKAEKFRDDMTTYFVLDNLETLRKNGRLSKAKALVASTLSIKPVMTSTDAGEIVQKGQAIGMKKALIKMAELIASEKPGSEQKTLMITHCNCPERAERFRETLLSKLKCKDVVIMDTAGVSSMYANDGGIIVTI
jgi:DegV family protein with EDD domain